jgi:hypothetical protein
MKIIIAILITLIASIPAFALNSYKATGKGSVEIYAISSNYDYKTHWSITKYPSGVNVKYVIFVPGSVNDRLVMRDGSASDPAIIDTGACQDVEARVVYIGKRVKPFVVFAEGAYSNGSKIIIMGE